VTRIKNVKNVFLHLCATPHTADNLASICLDVTGPELVLVGLEFRVRFRVRIKDMVSVRAEFNVEVSGSIS